MNVRQTAGLAWLIVSAVAVVWGATEHVLASLAISTLWFATDEVVEAIREPRE